MQRYTKNFEGPCLGLYLICMDRPDAALPENLQEIANLRIENPDLSLVELGKLLKEPIGKSGVNHRLKKISTIAKDLT